MKNFLLPIMLLFFCGASAQHYRIEAKILADGKALEMGNAVLLNSKDSSLITGSLINNGELKFDSVSQSTVILRINAIGQETYFKLIDNSSGNPVVSLGDISLSANKVLQGVVIEATVPLIQKKEGTTRVNVETTMLNAAGTALDILESSPGLMVTPEGAVTVFGKGQALVLLDGQRVPIEIIRALPSSQIRYVEIIEHPPASYDAQGRAVVNIVSKKNALEGYQLDFTNVLSMGLEHKNIYTYDGVNFFYKKKNISLLSRAGYYGGERFEGDEYLRGYEGSNGTVSMRNFVESQNKVKGVVSYGFGIRYQIDSTRTTDLFYNGDFSNTEATKRDTNTIQFGNDNYKLLALLNGDRNTLNHNINWAYSSKPDTMGSSRQWNISLSRYNNENEDRIQETYVDSLSTSFAPKRSIGNNNINIISIRSDIGNAFGKKNLFEYGGKLLAVSNKSEVNLARQYNADWQTDSTLSNGYRYDEQTAALYAQVTFRPEKWMIRPGLRAEFTHTRGFSERLNKTIIDTNYINIFPTVFGEYNFAKDWNMNMNYAFRINRPSFQDLDPFVMYIDSLSSMVGNPSLRPELTHEIAYSLVYLGAASIDLEYTFTQNSINTYVVRSPGTDKFYAQERNFKKADAINIGLEIPYENKWWTMSNSLGYVYGKALYDDGVTTASNSAELWYAFFYQQFRFLKRWSVEGMFSYNKGGNEGVFTGGTNYWMRLALAYKSENGKFNARIISNDLLRSNVTIGYSNIPGFDLTYRSFYDSYFVRAVVSWKLGKLKNEFSEKRINAEERERIKSN